MADEENNDIQIQRIVRADEARVMVTWGGATGDYPDTVPIDATDGDVKQWVAEAIRSGTVPGIRADANVNLADYVLDRYPASDTVPWARICARPKTPFGLSMNEPPCKHHWHAFRGVIMMVVRPGHVLQQCCHCDGLRQGHADHASD